MNDPLHELLTLAPKVDNQPEDLTNLRTDLMNLIDHESRSNIDQIGDSGRRRVRRKWVMPVIAAVLVLSTAAAYAISLSSSESTSVECPTGIYDAVTGDPVLDCSNEWRRATNSEPPTMIAYDNAQGGVVVLLADQSVPGGFTRIEAGQFQNTDIIELRASLDDVSAGLSSECFNEADARIVIQADLDRLALTAWTITVDSTRMPDGAALCARAIIEPDTQQVQVIGLSNSGETDPFGPFATAINAQLEAECLNIDEAVAAVRTISENADIRINGTTIEITEEAGVLVINTIEEFAATCSRADVNVGGRVEVTLRGPKG